MVESRGAVAPAGLGLQRDTLVATKLRVPRPRPGWKPRPRLVARLRSGSTRELMVVCGPAGFGKSSLLADWVRTDRRPVAWLSLDEGDNDPVRFWRYVCAALDGARPGVGERASALAGAGASTSIQAAVTALVNDFGQAPDEVLLVVDDYHVIQAPEVHRSVAFLLDHVPSALRLVVASRSDPPLPLARLRARGQLGELRANDLRFTRDEAAELLRAAVGHELPDHVVAALGERTEGWAAGLQLAGLSLRGRDDVAGFVAHFSGSHRYVLDYLTEEVLDRQAEPLAAFLLQTSILDRLCGPLCDALLGGTGSQQILERVERANLFLIPLDEERRWWRYHHLFADLLRVRLQQRHPRRVPLLHRAASEWHERHGLADDALRHALAAGDTDRAAVIVEANFEDQVLRLGEEATLTRWLSTLPPDAVHQRPRLMLGQAILALLNGRLDEGELLLARAERTADRGAEPYNAAIQRKDSIVANVPAAIAVGRADLACLRGDAERGGRFGRAALQYLTGEDELLGSIARYHAAVADWLAGRLEEAEHALVEITSDRPAASDRHAVLRAAYDLGGVHQAQGRLGAAVRTYERELAITRNAEAPASGMAHVGLAEVAYERNDLDAAREHASAGIERCRRLAYVPPLVAGLITLARIRLAEGDRVGAGAALDEAEEVTARAADLRTPLPAMRARLMMADGNVGEAARWVRARGLAADDKPAYPREHEYLVLARVLLAEQQPGQALTLLDRWRTLAADQGRVGSVINLRVLEVQAHAAHGDDRAALDAMTDALELAAPEGYIRVFLDEGDALEAPLRAVMANPRLVHLPRPFLVRLAEAFARGGTPVLPIARQGAVTVPGLVEPLTAREAEVLGLLAAGHSNRALANELVITVDTVKRHISHLFEKLGAANRTEAVARARQLGLLP